MRAPLSLLLTVGVVSCTAPQHNFASMTEAEFTIPLLMKEFEDKETYFKDVEAQRQLDYKKKVEEMN